MCFEKNKKLIYITNSGNEIKFFKSSNFKTIMQDLKYYLITLFFLSCLRYYFAKIKVNIIHEILSSLAITFPVLLYYKKMNFYSNIEDVINNGKYIIIIIVFLLYIIFIILIKNIFYNYY